MTSAIEMKNETNGDFWRRSAERAGIPPRTLAQVKAALERAERQGADSDAFARLMLRHGRMTDEARQYVGETITE